MLIEMSSKNGNLSLELLGVDEDPSKNKWFHFEAKAESSGFSGWCKFWIGPSKLRTYLSDLEQFDKSIKGHPILICGENEQELFRLEFMVYDRLGHIGTRIELTSQDIVREGTVHKARLEFDIELQALTDFRNGLHRMTAMGKNSKLVED